MFIEVECLLRNPKDGKESTMIMLNTDKINIIEVIDTDKNATISTSDGEFRTLVSYQAIKDVLNPQIIR